MIEARVVDITFNDDMVATIELDENDARAELNIRDKVSLVEEIARLREGKTANQYTKSASVSIGTEAKRQKEAKEAGFANKNEASRSKNLLLISKLLISSFMLCPLFFNVWDKSIYAVAVFMIAIHIL